MSTETVTPQTNQQDQTQQPQGTVNMVSPDGSDARQIPADQADAAKQSGWEPAVKMFNSGDQSDQRWIPISKVDAAKGAGYYPVLNQQTKSAVEGDAIKDDPVGNTILTAGGAGILKAGEAAGEAALDPAAAVIKDTASAAGDAVSSGARAMQDYALKAIGNLPKEGATSYLEQHGSGLLGLAAQHPEVLKIAAKYGLNTGGLLPGWKALNALVGK
jgi:hypothetical protein